MTLSISTQEEFLRALDQDPEFRQQVRRHILSVELIELPERLAELAQQVTALASHISEFTARQEAFNAEQRERNARQEGFNTRQEEFNAEQRERNARQEGFNTRQEAFIARQEEFNARQEAFNDEMREFVAEQRQFNRRVENDLGVLKGSVAIRVTRDQFETILDRLGLDYVKWLTRHDLIAMMRRGDSADIAVGDRQSFYRADLVLEASDAADLTHYIAVEASYTADRRDTDRAVRNADFLARFTGYPAHAVIASVSNDHDVQSLVDEGTVLWHQLTDRDLQPE